MTTLSEQAIGGVADPVTQALRQSARDLETRAPVRGQNHRMTLALVAGTCFVLGYLWAKARVQSP